MSAPFASSSSWAHWYRRALPAYWIFLFCLTHFPQLSTGIGVRWIDKVAHAGAFALLSFLFWRFRETLPRPVSARFVWTAAAWLGFYAIFDEYTQAIVGRGFEVLDLLSNIVGIVSTLWVLEVQRRRAARRAQGVAQ